MHTIPARDYWVHLLGGPCFQRFLPYFDRAAKHRGIPEQEWRIRHLYEPLLDRIKGRTITSNEIKQFMIDSLNQRGLKGEMKLQRGWQSKATHGPAWSGFNEMAFLGLLVNVGREGSESVWMGSADYLPTRQRPDPEECLVELIRKYIEHYDPVTRKDIVYWSYLTVGQVNRALEAMKKDLRKETISGQEYLSIDGESSEKLDPPGVIILPEFDSLMMGHRDKSRIFPPASQKKIFLTLGRISRTILLDGFVAATWKRKKERSGILVDVSPLRRLAAREKGSIEEEFVKYADYRKTQISVQFK
jgi:hypothetical protein